MRLPVLKTHIAQHLAFDQIAAIFRKIGATPRTDRNTAFVDMLHCRSP